MFLLASGIRMWHRTLSLFFKSKLGWDNGEVVVEGGSQMKGEVSMIEITKDMFEVEVLNSSVPVLVEFWAPWCKPCRTVEPTLERISINFTGRAKVVRVNTELCPVLAARYAIRGLPTTILFNRGKLVQTTLGIRPQGEYERLLGDALQERLPENDWVESVSA